MRFRLALVFSSLAVALCFGACSNQGEGEICDPNAGNGGNDDCQTGLMCTQIQGVDKGFRCCPGDRLNQATTAVCSISGSSSALGDASSTAPDGTSPAEAGADAAEASAPAADAGDASNATDAGEAAAPGDAADAGSPGDAGASGDAPADASAG